VWGPGRGPNFGSDFQEPYVADWLRWAGITDIASIRFQPNLAVADPAPGRAMASAQARDVAKTF